MLIRETERERERESETQIRTTSPSPQVTRVSVNTASDNVSDSVDEVTDLESAEDYIIQSTLERELTRTHVICAHIYRLFDVGSVMKTALNCETAKLAGTRGREFARQVSGGPIRSRSH